MGLFGKRQKAVCPICGREMGLIEELPVSDGSICKGCAGLLRGEYPVRFVCESVDEEGKEHGKQYDPLREMPVAQLRALLEEKARERKAAAARHGACAALFRIEDAFVIAPKPLEFGLRYAKLLKNKLVVRGAVQSGSFTKGDAVVILHGQERIETVLLKAFPCDERLDFKFMMASTKENTVVSAPAGAWLILNDGGAEIGDAIEKP